MNNPPTPPEGYVAVEPGHGHVEVIELVEPVPEGLHPDVMFDWAQEPDRL